jgi:Lytic polysaccharide mono-oxygenase, cellulose-degrading
MSIRFCVALAALVALVALVGLPRHAAAHVQMKTPLQREVDQKVGPCGVADSVRSANVCQYRPGATITVAWDETIEHPGHFRISFDQDGDDDFVDPEGYDDLDSAESVLLDGIADRDVRSGDPGYTQEVTLPDIECDGCTLQLIQVMTDKPPYGDGNDIYYQCADLVLSASAPADPADACAAAGGGDDGEPDESDDSSGDDSASDGDSAAESGCSASGGAGGPLACLVPLLVAALALPRRHR